MSKKLQHDHTLTAITALAFHQACTGQVLLLAGEGPYLKIFDAESSRIINQHQIFHSQVIHGVVIKDYVANETDLQVAIWGASSLMLLCGLQWQNLLLQDKGIVTDWEFDASDWLIDIALHPGSSVMCAIATAHNKLLQGELQRVGNSRVITTVSCSSRSMLYSAHVVWDTVAKILVAAGTVFGEIIVWTACFDTSPENGQVLFAFRGHEGSVFGLHLSSKHPRPNRGEGRLLVSCSDDRTIRIWDVNQSTVVYSRPEGETPNVVSSDTGFGGSWNGAPQIQGEQCMAVIMGHASRIWRVELQSVTKSLFDIFSFGEDATAQQWLLEPRYNADHPYDLRHVRTLAFHNGKHIWSTATWSQAESRIFATGGSDGKIALFEIPHAIGTPSMGIQPMPSSSLSGEHGFLKFKAPTMHRLSFEAILQCSPVVSGMTNDNFGRFAFLSESHLIMTTALGRVWLGMIDQHPTWRELKLPIAHRNDLTSYSVVRTCREMTSAFLAGSNGNIFLYRPDTDVQLLAKVDRKVADLFTAWGLGAIWLGITGLRGQPLNFFELQVQEMGHVEVARRLTCSFPESFTVTCMGCVENIAVFGSRQGLLAFRKGMTTNASLQVCGPDLGSTDAVTSILAMPKASLGVAYFVTTCRDGTYSIYSCTPALDGQDEAGELSIRRIHQGRPPFGPMIENAWFRGTNLILQGFKSKNFVVWNETEQSEIMSVECGGAHRSYAFTHCEDTSGGKFVFTRASKMCIYSQQDSSHRTMKRGGHGREIKACAVSSDQALFATGAEDTDIRIWTYADHQQTLERGFRCLTTIRKHTSGIQCLQWYKSEYLFSSAGNDEFYVWAVQNIPGFGIGVICEASCPNRSKNRDLRVMSFDASDLISGDIQIARRAVLLSLAYSDSSVQTYIYSRLAGFRLIAETVYTSACLTHIKHMRIKPGGCHIITVATDGNISLWRCNFSDTMDAGFQQGLPSSHDFITSINIHQNAIKSISISDAVESDYYVIALGGDDNALSITILNAKDFEGPPQIFIARSAHAAAVTALCFVHYDHAVLSDTRRVWRARLISSGNDQSLRIWMVEVAFDMLNEKSSVAKEFKMYSLEDFPTTIADVAAVEVLRNKGADKARSQIAVVGNGIEVLSLRGP